MLDNSMQYNVTLMCNIKSFCNITPLKRHDMSCSQHDIMSYRARHYLVKLMLCPTSPQGDIAVEQHDMTRQIDDSNVTGHDMKLIRDKFGLTQSELAVFLKVDPRTIQRWEQSEFIPETAKLKLSTYVRQETARRQDAEQAREALLRKELELEICYAKLDYAEKHNTVPEPDYAWPEGTWPDLDKAFQAWSAAKEN